MRPGSTILGLVLSLSVLAMSQVFAAGSAEARYASIVVDAETGEVLRSRNADIRRYPASLTKMMTLYLLFEAIDEGRFSLTSKLKVSKRAAGQPPSKLGLGAGSTIEVEDAIKALVVKSANDIAVVVAEALGGTEVEFARMMTRKARALGMSRTTFRNASGLPNRKQRSTARDMSFLARALMRDFPHRYHYFDDQRFRYGKRSASLAEPAARQLSRHGRHKDRLHPGVRLQSRGVGGTRWPACRRGGLWRQDRAPRATSTWLPFSTSASTRIAERDAKRGRVRYAGIPRPPAGSGLAAPSPRFKPRSDHGRGRRGARTGRRGCRASGRDDGDRRGVGGGGRRGPAAAGTRARKAGDRDDDGRGAHACTRSSGVAEGVPGGLGDRPPLGRPGRRLRGRSRQPRSPCAARPRGRRCSATRYRPSFPAMWGPARSIGRVSWGSTRATPVRACRTLRPSPMPCVIIRGLDTERDPAIAAAS